LKQQDILALDQAAAARKLQMQMLTTSGAKGRRLKLDRVRKGGSRHLGRRVDVGLAVEQQPCHFDLTVLSWHVQVGPAVLHGWQGEGHPTHSAQETSPQVISLLSEIHLSFYSFVDEGKISMDLFTCDISHKDRNLKRMMWY
jgi:hypothetical protein